MGAIEIAGLVMGAVGNLSALAARMLVAKDAEVAELLKQMQDEVGKAQAYLRDGGELDKRYAASDAKLDAAIDAEKKRQEDEAKAKALHEQMKAEAEAAAKEEGC